MFNTKFNNINTIIETNGNSSIELNWLQQMNVSNKFELSNEYAHICHQHKEEKKWVLFINPEENSIEKLAKTHGVDVSKILMVNYKSALTKQTKIELERIKSVLSKGNCSAVILSNSLFETDEIEQLEDSAKAGKTQCFLIKQNKMH